MKKLYKQLMKTSALICLLLLGTSNVWATVYTWTGSNSSSEQTHFKYANSANNAAQIGSAKETPVWYYSAKPGYNTSYKGINVQYGQAATLTTTETGFVTLYLQAAGNTTASIKVDNEVITSCSPEVRNQTNGDGTLLNFKMEKGKNYIMSGHSYMIHIKKVVFYTPDEVKSITLKETDTNADNQQEVTNSSNSNPAKKFVSIERTLRGNQWNTFCLPINLTATELNDYFKCSAVYELSGYNSADKTISFAKKTSYTACTPCLIMPPADVKNPSFITTSLSMNTNALTKGDSGLNFIGVLGATNIYTTGDENSTKFYLNTEGNLVYPKSDTGNNGKIKGFRAYFEWTGTGGGSVKDLNFVFDDSETTGIKTIEHDNFGENGRVYSIDGRYMGDSTDNLSRGIYIQNGRKFVVK